MKGKMKAAVFVDDGNLQVLEVDIPQMKNAKDVLIKIEACSICGSDVSVVSIPRRHPATPNIIIGHEYMGTIVEVGSEVTGFQPGERVIVEPNIACGECDMCKKGFTNMCPNMKLIGFHYNGGMAEYTVMPDMQLHKMKQDMPATRAVMAEPLACILNSLNKFNVLPGDYCLVLGAGPIGLMYIKLMQAAGAKKIIVSECMDLRKKVAESVGAIVVDPRKTDLNQFVMANTNGKGADVVIDCVGSLMEDAVNNCSSGGKVVLFGLDSNAKNNVEPFDISHKEITIYGSYVVNNTFPRAIRILEDNVVDLTDIVTHVIKLEDVHDGFDAIAKGEAIKVVVQCN